MPNEDNYFSDSVDPVIKYVKLLVYIQSSYFMSLLCTRNFQFNFTFYPLSVYFMKFPSLSFHYLFMHTLSTYTTQEHFCTIRENYKKNLHHSGKAKFCTTRENSQKKLNFTPNFTGKNCEKIISFILNHKKGFEACFKELGSY